MRSRAPGPGYVRWQVQAAGVCGTDLHIEAGEYPSVPPVTMGHEVCGVVEALGDGVDAAWAGRAGGQRDLLRDLRASARCAARGG